MCGIKLIHKPSFKTVYSLLRESLLHHGARIMQVGIETVFFFNRSHLRAASNLKQTVCVVAQAKPQFFG